MKWMRERDLLIAQTMAFVQSVTGKKPEADSALARPLAHPATELSGTAPRPPAMPDVEALLAESIAVPRPNETPQPRQTARPDLRNDIQSEIKARVANFRAHQEKFHRERDAYCSATMAKVHATLRDGAGPSPLEK